MARYLLNESGRAVADANGVATVRIGPRRAFEKWHITSVAIQSDSVNSIPEMREYRGDVADSRLIGSSFTGTLDSGTADINLMPGEDIVYQWTRCDVGANCVATLQGEKFHP